MDQGIEPKPPEQEGKEPGLPATEGQPVDNLLIAMVAEIKTLTAKGIEGEIFCLEAMFP